MFMPLLIQQLDTSSCIFQPNAVHFAVKFGSIRQGWPDRATEHPKEVTGSRWMLAWWYTMRVESHSDLVIWWSVHKVNVIVMRGTLGHPGLAIWHVVLLLSQVVLWICVNVGVRFNPGQYLHSTRLKSVECQFTWKSSLRSYLLVPQTITDPPPLLTWGKMQLEQKASFWSIWTLKFSKVLFFHSRITVLWATL